MRGVLHSETACRWGGTLTLWHTTSTSDTIYLRQKAETVR
jgi:hypothetical protein